MRPYKPVRFPLIWALLRGLAFLQKLVDSNGKFPNTLPGRMKNCVRNIRNVTDPVKTHVKLTSISGPDASRAALLLGCHFRHIGILKPSGYRPVYSAQTARRLRIAG